MPLDELTHRKVYEQTVAALRKLGADQLADEIERTVARGVVLTGQQTASYKDSAVFRPMTDEEALAVAMEFFVTVLEVPVMLDAATRTWEPGISNGNRNAQGRSVRMWRSIRCVKWTTGHCASFWPKSL